MGRLIILLGIILIAVGLMLQYAPWLINWFGRLPGDIRIDNEKTKIFIPITSMILVSLILSIIMRIFKK
jgi:hypothetical protein